MVIFWFVALGQTISGVSLLQQSVMETQDSQLSASSASIENNNLVDASLQHPVSFLQKFDKYLADVPLHHRLSFIQASSPEKWYKIPCDVLCYWPEPMMPPKCKDPTGLWCDQDEFQQISFGSMSEPIRVRSQHNGTNTLLRHISILGLNEGLTVSMEPAAYYPTLKEDLGHRGTTSLKSAVPFQYFSWANGPFEAAINYDSVIKGASYLARSCTSRNGREALMKALSKHIRIDSMGACFHNAERPRGTNDNKFQIVKRYLFHLAFENSNELDHVTEKLWDSLRAGTLPIYFGAPNIEKLVPPKSLINVHNFRTWDDLGQHLQVLIRNKTKYMEYHQWRKKPLPEFFKKTWDFARVHSSCRICRWAFARREGFGWDIPTQQVLNFTH